MEGTGVKQSLATSFAAIKTYGELREALPETGLRRVPGIKQLKAAAIPILRERTTSGVIEVYDNGFFTYKEGGRTTVYAVDRCSVLKWHSCTGEILTSEGANLDGLPWSMPLEMVGTDRLAATISITEQKHSATSLEDPSSTNSIRMSVRPEHEMKEEAEIYASLRHNNILRMKTALETLTEKQREIVNLICLEQLTQEQVAVRIGIQRRTVREQYEAAEKKIKKFFENTRHFDPKKLYK